MRRTLPILSICSFLVTSGILTSLSGAQNRVSSVGNPVACSRPVLGQVESLGVATVGTEGPLELAMAGLPIVGFPFRLEVRNGLPWAPGYLVFGLGTAPTPLPSLGTLLYPAPVLGSLLFRVGFDGVSGPLLARLPVSTATCGVPIVAQGFVNDVAAPGGVASTKAARIRFGLEPGKTFYPVPAPVVGGEGKSVVHGDFDKDGDLDLAVAAQAFPSHVSVFRNEGRGRFAPALVHDLPSPPNGLVAGDLNNDGNLDLAVSMRSFDAVRVLSGQGDGTFVLASDVVMNDAYSAALGDLDADGFLDLATTSLIQDQVGAFRGNGDGTFTSLTVRNVGDSPKGVLLVDLDTNGTTDLAVGNGSSDSISRFLGNGDGTFGSGNNYQALGGGWLVSGDFDENGTVDLATEEAVVLGNGDGSFGPQFQFGSRLGYPLALDVNGDGHLDLTGHREVLLGTGNGSFGGPILFEAGIAVLEGMDAVDFDGDGRPDLIVAGSNRCALLYGLGNGGFLGPDVKQVNSSPLSSSITVLELADLNGDQILDGVSGASRGLELYVSLGSGGGSFEDVVELDDPNSTASASVNSLQIVDLDGDGHLDLLYGVQGGALQPRVLSRYGLGDGSFEDVSIVSASPTNEAVGAADLDEDGLMDVVIGNYFTENIDVLLGMGGRAFGLPTSYACGDRPVDLELADVDGDGHVDVVTANEDSDDATVLFGVGDGSFTGRLDLTAGGEPKAIAVGDVDSDGLLDLVVGHRVSRDVVWFRGTGARTFAAGMSLSIDDSIASVEIADVTGDGLADILAGGTTGTNLLQRRADGSFALRGFGGGPRSYSLATGDLDGDLVPDLLVGGLRTLGVLLHQYLE